MGKWSATVVLMMLVIVAAVTVEAEERNSWIKCFRDCSDSKHCSIHDGDCFERCKIQCGGPNPPGGLSPPPPRRISHEMASVEAKQNSWIKCFRDCSDSKHCNIHDGDCFERCKIQCGGPNPPHGLFPPPRRI